MRLLFAFITFIIGLAAHALPNGFVYLSSVEPNIVQSMRYFQNNNFTARPVKGYVKSRCIVTRNTAKALKDAQNLANEKGYNLLVYDCYRPVTAVKEFYKWSFNQNNQKKREYYPNESKRDLFKKGYIALYSSHSLGVSVDVTLIKKGVLVQKASKECTSPLRIQDNSLDMGTNYDCLDKKSHVFSARISKKVLKNRLLLRTIMTKAGFSPYSKEWWHFTLKHKDNNKPYDFYVK